MSLQLFANCCTAVLLTGRFGILEGEFLSLSMLVEGSVSIQHGLLLNGFCSGFDRISAPGE